MSTTVTGNINDLTGTAVTSNCYVRFWLRGCNGNQPRVGGSALIAPDNGPTYFQDFTPNASGQISGTLYSNNVNISAGGQVGVTWYGVQVFLGGIPGAETPYALADGTTFNLNSATPISTNPVVASPTGDSTYVRLDDGNIASAANPFLWSTPINFKNQNSIRFADQFGGFTNASIQAAIDDCPAGGTVFMPSGTYVCSGSGADLIHITKPINLRGAGTSTILQVASTVPNSTDVIHVSPPSLIEGLVLEDFAIMMQSGNPARYGINFDCPTFGVSHCTVSRVRIGDSGSTTGNYALQHTNTSNNTPLFLATFSDNTFWGGVNLDNIADSILFIRNNVTGPRDLRVNSVTSHADGGAHGVQIIGNNLTPAGGINIVNAPQGVFAYNDIEQPVTSTNSNNCLLGVLGVTGNHVLGFQIVGNYLGATTGNVQDTIRVDFADGTIIRDNLIVRGSTGVTYRITANASDTQILNNRQVPFGEAITTFLADSGTRTQVDWMDTTAGQRLITPFIITSTGNTQVFGAFGTQVRAQGSSGVIGFTSNATVTAGLDTGFSRLAGNVIGAGNGAFGDVTAQTRCAIRSWPESAAPGFGAGFAFLWNDSTAHRLKMSNNNSAAALVTGTDAATSQKAESAADTNVLTFTPPAVAGSYRLRFVLSISAAASAVVGWTATWKDSNGTAKAPTNLSLFQVGTAAPALTFTTSTTDDFYGYADIDTDASATNIVIKFTLGSGTITAKASATVERLI